MPNDKREDTVRDNFIPMARRAIMMSLTKEKGWQDACKQWLIDYDQVALQNAIDLEGGVDNRFTWRGH